MITKGICHLPKEKINLLDAPLSFDGYTKSVMTGRFIKKNFKYDKLVLTASPFVRTIMTAAGIAEGFGLKLSDVTCVVDYGLIEVQTDGLYGEDPVPKLEYNKLNKYAFR